MTALRSLLLVTVVLTSLPAPASAALFSGVRKRIAAHLENRRIDAAIQSHPAVAKYHDRKLKRLYAKSNKTTWSFAKGGFLGGGVGALAAGASPLSALAQATVVGSANGMLFGSLLRWGDRRTAREAAVQFAKRRHGVDILANVRQRAAQASR